MDWLDDACSGWRAGVAVAIAAVIIWYATQCIFGWLAVIRPAHAERGIASVYTYGHGTLRGHPTACGVAFNPGLLTAAHRTLACGSMVKVTTGRGRSVIVRITDRGPFRKGRVIDLTPAAARALRMDGLAMVSVVVLKR